jgi:dihydrofolate reductase
MSKPEVRLVAAIDDKHGLAKAGKIPWDLPTDRRYFQEKVKDGPVVMGWNTFKSNHFKPYGNGSNTVITRQETETMPGVWIVHDADIFFKSLKTDIWVAGGGQIFTAALPYATELYLTRVEGDYDCDVFFPEFEPQFVLDHEGLTQTENGISYVTQVWRRKA